MARKKTYDYQLRKNIRYLKRYLGYHIGCYGKPYGHNWDLLLICFLRKTSKRVANEELYRYCTGRMRAAGYGELFDFLEKRWGKEKAIAKLWEVFDNNAPKNLIKGADVLAVVFLYEMSKGPEIKSPPLLRKRMPAQLRRLRMTA